MNIETRAAAKNRFLGATMHEYELVERLPDHEPEIWILNSETGDRERQLPIELNQEYCDFLTWNAKQPQDTRLRRGWACAWAGPYFSDQVAFEKHLLREGKRLFAKGLKEGHCSQTKLPGFDSEIFTVPLCRIAWPSDPESPLTVDGDVVVTDPLFRAIIVGLEDDDSTLRWNSSLSIDRSFVFIDVSDFSERLPIHQLLIIEALIKVVNYQEFWDLVEYKHLEEIGLKPESQLCIGDGYVYVFRDPCNATIFAAHLALIIERMVAIEHCIEFHFRMSVHCGSVFRFWETDVKRWNYIGEGINDAARVLAAIGQDHDDVLFVSGEVRKKIAEAENDGFFGHAPDSLLRNLHNRGRRKDKHNRMHRVYELNHTEFAVLPGCIDPSDVGSSPPIIS